MAHQQLNTFHLFSGAGGGILADLLLGHIPIGACEIEKYPRDVLLARQRDGILPNFPIWDDVCSLDGTPWRGSVDVLCGGFPCQDISAAGKGAGISGERSGLWKEYARLIGEMRPRFVFAENSPLLRTRGLGVVLEDLASLGYNARWGVLGARDVGAPHKRDRMWVLAYAKELQCNGREDYARKLSQSEEIPESGDDSWKENLSDCFGLATDPKNMAYTSLHGHPTAKESEGTTQGGNSGASESKQTIEPSGLRASRADGGMEGTPEDMAYAASIGQQGSWLHGRPLNQAENQDWKANWTIDPGEGYETERNTIARLDRVVDGVANRVDRLKAIGNGQVPQCAAVAFSILSEGLI